MKLEDLQSLRFWLGFDPELRAVFDAIPYTALGEVSKSQWRKAIRHGKPLPGGTHVTIMGYSKIGRKSGVTGIRLDRALAKLISLRAVKTVKRRREEGKVLGNHDYYLRLLEL